MVYVSRKNGVMPNFHKDNRVYTDSLIQIAEGINDAVNRFAKGKIRFGKKKKVNKARMLNGLYLWFLRQSKTEQDRIIGGIMPLLYQHHESAERIEIDSVTPTVGGGRTYAAGSHPTKVDRESKNRLSGEVSLPKRGS